ncbi:MAG: helix-turn-helix transcriptional regulator [Spirochaetales bacterium]|nr:helix-turn-helix transcriptional regulator [Spirochaetales bacterium]
MFFPISIDEVSGFVKPKTPEKRFSISYIQTGEAVFESAGKSYVLQAPVLLLQNEETEMSVTHTAGLDCASVFFHPSVINSHLDYDILRKRKKAEYITDTQDTYLFEVFGTDPESVRVLPLNSHKNSECEFLFKKLIHAVAHDETDYCPCWMRAVLISLLIFLLDMEKDIDEVIEVSTHPYDFKDVILYLYSHYREDLTLGGIAKEFGTNRTTLNEKFRRTVGCSAMAFVRNIRVTAAAKYLRTTDESVTRVCTDSGFKDVSYFCKLFRQTFGTSPKEYRSMYSQTGDKVQV